MIKISPIFEDIGFPPNLSILSANVTINDGGAGLTQALEECVTKVEGHLKDQTVQDHPVISITRKVYKALGKDPARYRPSAEALRRRVKQGKGLYRINNLVDITNMISLQTGFSIGTYDADKIEGEITFRRAEAGEIYRGIGRAELNLEGLPVFADSQGPFGSPTSDSDRTCISDQTSNMLMVIIGFEGAKGIEEATDLAAQLLAAHCEAWQNP